MFIWTLYASTYFSQTPFSVLVTCVGSKFWGDVYPRTLNRHISCILQLGRKEIRNAQRRNCIEKPPRHGSSLHFVSEGHSVHSCHSYLSIGQLGNQLDQSLFQINYFVIWVNLVYEGCPVPTKKSREEEKGKSQYLCNICV